MNTGNVVENAFAVGARVLALGRKGQVLITPEAFDRLGHFDLVKALKQLADKTSDGDKFIQLNSSVPHAEQYIANPFKRHLLAGWARLSSWFGSFKQRYFTIQESLDKTAKDIADAFKKGRVKQASGATRQPQTPEGMQPIVPTGANVLEALQTSLKPAVEAFDAVKAHIRLPEGSGVDLDAVRQGLANATPDTWSAKLDEALQAVFHADVQAADPAALRAGQSQFLRTAKGLVDGSDLPAAEKSRLGQFIQQKATGLEAHAALVRQVNTWDILSDLKTLSAKLDDYKGQDIDEVVTTVQEKLGQVNHDNLAATVEAVATYLSGDFPGKNWERVNHVRKACLQKCSSLPTLLKGHEPFKSLGPNIDALSAKITAVEIDCNRFPSKPGKYLPDTRELAKAFDEIRFKYDFGGQIGDDWFEITSAEHLDEGIITFLDGYRGHSAGRLGSKTALTGTIDDHLLPLLEQQGLKAIQTENMPFDQAIHTVKGTTYTTDPDFIGKVHTPPGSQGMQYKLGFQQRQADGSFKIVRLQEVNLFAAPSASTLPQTVDSVFAEVAGSQQVISGLPAVMTEIPLAGHIHITETTRKRLADLLDKINLDEIIVQTDPDNLPKEVFHGTQPWSVKAIREHGFDILQPVKNGHTLDVGQAVYLTTGESWANRYGSTIIKTRINPKNPAIVKGYDEWHQLREIFGDIARDILNAENLPEECIAPLQDRITREFFTKRGFDAVYFPVGSRKAGVPYIAMYDPKQIEILDVIHTQSA